MRELKAPISLEEQVQGLRDKGFVISDEKAVADFINRVGYYRLRAYMLPFKENGRYISGINFSQVMRLYEFDSELRAWLWRLLGDIECYVRAQLANYMSLKYGAECYLNANIFPSRNAVDHDKFLLQIERALANNRNSPIIRHHQRNYGGKLPFWVVIEFFSAGMLSFMYSDLSTADQKAIAKTSFRVGNLQLASWLRAFTELRNKCAHYARLYDIRFTTAPRDFRGSCWTMDRTLFSQIYMLAQLYPNKEQWWGAVLMLENLLNEYADVNIVRMGFPDKWQELLCPCGVGYRR